MGTRQQINILILGLAIIAFTRLIVSAEENHPIISIVFLKDRTEPLAEDQLLEKVNTAFDIHLEADSEEHGFVAAKDNMSFVVIRDMNKAFLINSFNETYFDVTEDFLKEVKEVRFREAFKAHKAWMSVDIMGDVPEESTVEAYQDMGRLAAELLDKNVLMVCLPQFDICDVVSTGTREKLLSRNPIEALSEMEEAPIVDIDSDDSRMKAATEEARRRWSEFVTVFSDEASDKSNFSAKFPFKEGDSTEFIWVNVDRIEDGFVYGRLGNDPVYLKSYKLGDKVSAPISELNDWIYFLNDEMIGGFTVKILMDEYTRP